MTLLALDCGGTRSRALMQTNDGNKVLEREAGPANWAATPPDELESNLRDLLKDVSEADLGVSCMAGILTDEDKGNAEHLLSSITPAKWHVLPDTTSSLASCDDPNAVCVISGTGSGVCSYDVDHHLVKSGGGGPLVGDFGSGFYAGRVALGRFLRNGAELPRLTERLEAAYGAGGIQTWLSAIYGSASPQAEIAKVGSLVAALATDGDEAAQSILGDAMQPLADLTLDHMGSQGFPGRPFKVFLAGGFWESSHYVPKLFGILLRLPTYRPPLTSLEGAMRIAQSLSKP